MTSDLPAGLLASVDARIDGRLTRLSARCKDMGGDWYDLGCIIEDMLAEPAPAQSAALAAPSVREAAEAWLTMERDRHGMSTPPASPAAPAPSGVDALAAIQALLDKHGIGLPGGTRTWALAERVEIACMAANDREAHELREQAERERDEARAEVERLRASRDEDLIDARLSGHGDGQESGYMDGHADTVTKIVNFVLAGCGGELSDAGDRQAVANAIFNLDIPAPPPGAGLPTGSTP